MDFEFDDAQRELQLTAQRMLAKAYPAAAARRVAEGASNGDELWPSLVALEWPGLAIAPADGGVGATMVELAVVLEQLGRVVDPSPMLATTTQYVPAIQAWASPAQRGDLLASVTQGGTGAVAWSQFERNIATVEATRVRGGHWLLSGSIRGVLDGDRAADIVVPAITEDGVKGFVVDGAQIGRVRLPTFDPSLHLADITLEDVVLGDERRLPGADDTALSPLPHALVGLSLSAVGAAQRAFELTVDYAGRREQFGAPIGSFQAVQHKAVDMYVALERARALAFFAATALAEDDPRRELAASMAKSAAGDAQALVFRHAIQTFGGIGYTWENDLHLYLRRAKATHHLFGDTHEHRRRVGRIVLESRSMIGVAP
jgi:alkylation response protein AidB-like acyl-CoA dehydrogenase